ncbi:GSCOCG00007266001-RA-CDS, partial [Cotesia congregata]
EHCAEDLAVEIINHILNSLCIYNTIYSVVLSIKLLSSYI